MIKKDGPPPNGLRVVLIPVVVVFFVAQKQFIRGIALTGVKG